MPALAELQRAFEGRAVTTPGLPLETLEQACVASIRKALDDRDTNASLAALTRRISTDYKDRAVSELIQNAHDAHPPGAQGEIVVRLIKRSDGAESELHVANKGAGFTWPNVDAVRRPARSTKTFGEGIGNKGLGFRSVHILTDAPEVYSCQGEARAQPQFDGFCFGFASDEEAERLFLDEGASRDDIATLLKDVPRSLLTRALKFQTTRIQAYAREGFATVVRIPLRTSDALESAEAQVRALLDPATPPALFLERVSRLEIAIEDDDKTVVSETVERKPKSLGTIEGLVGATLETVQTGSGTYLVARYRLPREELHAEIRKSLKLDERLETWLDSEEDSVVMLAVRQGVREPSAGRLYCFLPLDAGERSPLLGHLNAPFVVRLNRKSLEAGIPVNAFLFAQCARLATAAAQEIAQRITRGERLDRFAGVDLMAWETLSPQIGPSLLAASAAQGASIRNLPILPLADQGWGALAQVCEWTTTGELLKPAKLARLAQAPLLDPKLGAERLKRVRELARSAAQRSNLKPSVSAAADWIEATARKLSESRKPLSGWGAFLREAVLALDANGLGLEALAGRGILLDREGGRISAQGSGEPVYIGSAARRTNAESQASKLAPPAALKRRIRFVHEDIKLDAATREAMIEAGLLTDYDPLAVLENLPSLLAAKPKEATLSQVLKWAFDVWSAGPKAAAAAVQAAALAVPCRSGWGRASVAIFSEKWTENGRRLDAVCRDLRGRSPEMTALTDTFLAAPQDERWPRRSGPLKDWIDFLTCAQVGDGLGATACVLAETGYANETWSDLFSGVRAGPGLTASWRAAIKRGFSYPQSRYDRVGQICRLPGQDDHGLLSEAGKFSYAQLILAFLAQSGPGPLRFTLSARNKNDARVYPTPLAVFLREAEWIPVIGPGNRHASPEEVWWRRVRARDVTRVVLRPEEEIRTALDPATNLTVLFDHLGLNDWSDPRMAARKIDALATAVERGHVGEADRGPVRTASAEAWKDLMEGGGRLGSPAAFVATRGGRLVCMRSPEEGEATTTVYVADGQPRFETRLLLELDQVVLEGVAATSDLLTCLKDAGFDALAADKAEIQVLVDGGPFSPDGASPRLMGDGRAWLADLAVMSLDAEGRGLAMQISRAQFRQTLNKVRLVFPETAVVSMAGQPMPAHRGAFLAIRDAEFPTLIAVGRRELGWADFGELGRALERLVDGRADGALRMGFMLAAQQMGGAGFARPTDEVLARAMNLPEARVREASLEGLSVNLHLIDYLVPAVACAASLEMAQALLADMSDAESAFDAVSWLSAAGFEPGLDMEAFVRRCVEAEDRNGLRRTLGLGLADFNAALTALGREPLENRADLEGQFRHHLDQQRSALLDRLRAFHLEDFDEGRDLSAYVSRRTLDFMTFDEAWAQTHEEIDAETVAARAQRLFNELYGTLTDVPQPVAEVSPQNQKTLSDAAESVLQIVPAWCAGQKVSVPPNWVLSRLELVRAVDGRGLLDFRLLDRAEVAELLDRADLWPTGMPLTLDVGVLKLTMEDLAAGERMRQESRRRAERKARAIQYGGKSYDGGDEDEMQALAEALRVDMVTTCRAADRFLEAELAIQDDPVRSRDPRSGRKRTPVSREPRMTDVQKSAIGYLGEVRALEWLKWKYQLSDEAARLAWVSRYRRTGLVTEEGEDRLGFDFELTLGNGRRIQYEVKASIADPQVFHLGSTEVAAALESASGRRGTADYRLLYVPFVSTPEKWRILELPNPLAAATRKQFQEQGRTGLQYGFEMETTKPGRQSRGKATSDAGSGRA